MDAQDIWIEDLMRETTRIASAVSDDMSWEDVARIVTERGNQDLSYACWHLMTAYKTGKEFDALTMVEQSKRLMTIKTPDLEVRLPWYDTMFVILDKGEFCDDTDHKAGGPWYFELKDEDFRQLIDYLAENASLERGTAGAAVDQLSRDVGHIPGVHYTNRRMMNGKLQHRAMEIALISQSLHLPMSKITTVSNDETVAEAHYDTILDTLGLRHNEREAV